MANRMKPTPYAWAPTKSGRRLAQSIDQPLREVAEGEHGSTGTSSSVTSSSTSSTPKRPVRGNQYVNSKTAKKLLSPTILLWFLLENWVTRLYVHHGWAITFMKNTKICHNVVWNFVGLIIFLAYLSNIDSSFIKNVVIKRIRLIMRSLSSLTPTLALIPCTRMFLLDLVYIIVHTAKLFALFQLLQFWM